MWSPQTPTGVVGPGALWIMQCCWGHRDHQGHRAYRGPAGEEDTVHQVCRGERSVGVMARWQPPTGLTGRTAPTGSGLGSDRATRVDPRCFVWRSISSTHPSTLPFWPWLSPRCASSAPSRARDTSLDCAAEGLTCFQARRQRLSSLPSDTAHDPARERGGVRRLCTGSGGPMTRRGKCACLARRHSGGSLDRRRRRAGAGAAVGPTEGGREGDREAWVVTSQPGRPTDAHARRGAVPMSLSRDSEKHCESVSSPGPRVLRIYVPPTATVDDGDWGPGWERREWARPCTRRS